MIAWLKGNVIEVNLDTFVIEANNVGYEVSTTHQNLADLQSLMGQSVQVWIHTHVREDAFQLFGFLDRYDKEFFLQLLKVNGIGPKMAMTIMSGAPVNQLREWIETSDAKALSKLPKVGKKTAEQMILTLQGQLVRVETKAKEKSSQKALPEIHKQIASALVNLGFKSQNVDEFVATLGLNIKMEEGVREGLRALSGQGN